LRAPILTSDLLTFRSLLDLRSFDDALLFSMCLVGFFGFLRISELLSTGPSGELSKYLNPADLTWLPGRLDVLLRTSKTDHLRQGVTVTLGAADSLICPLKTSCLSVFPRAFAASLLLPYPPPVHSAEWATSL
jgi:hypothetical protein